MVVAAAGNLSHDVLIEEIEIRLKQGHRPETNGVIPIKYPPPRLEKFPRAVQGVHLCRGLQGVSYSDKRRMAALVLSNILGGGMSSRLFQRVREKEALAYNVFSFLDTMKHTGTFGIYLGTDPQRLDHALKVLDEEYNRIMQEGILEDELTRVKEQLKGNLVLGLEGTSGRMFRLAKLEIYLGRFLTLDETIAMIESVTMEEVMKLSREFLNIDKQYTAIILPKEEAVHDYRSSQGNQSE